MLLLHARFLIPIAQPPIERGTVGIEDGIIRYVGPRSQAPVAGEERELGDVVLMPGLINAHTHLELTVMRGFLEDLEFRRWIFRLTGARRSVLSRAMLLDSARLGVQEGLAAGITTFADTGSSGVALDAMLEYGVRGTVYHEVFGPDPAMATAALAELRVTVEAMRLRETALVRVGVSPHAPYTVSDVLFRATAEYAREAGLAMAIHIAEGDAESRLVSEGAGPFADGLRGRGITVERRARSPIQLLADLDVLRARPLLIHCVRVDAQDVAAAIAGARLRRRPIVHVSNAKLGHGIAPLVELLDAGVDVGLGSDSMASNNRMDLLDEARVAQLMQRVRLASPDALSAHDALRLATLGGATALGLARQVGSLEVGKSADLAAFPIGVRGPVQDPESAAVLALGGSRASLVMIEGRTVVDGVPVNGDPDLPARVQQTADLLQQWLIEGGELRPPVPLLPAHPAR